MRIGTTEAPILMIRGHRLSTKSATWILVGVAVASTATLTRARLRREEPNRGPVRPATGSGAASPVGLRAETQTGTLKLTWDRESALVKNATAGVLTIRDGDSEQAIELSAAMVRSGNIVYSPATGRVSSRLTVTGPEGTGGESVVAVIPQAEPLPRPVAAVFTVRPAPVVRLGKRAVAAAKPEPPAAEVLPPGQGPARAEAVPARDSRPPGTIEIEVSIDETGTVTDAELLTPAGEDRRFSEAALRAARLWKFEPARPGEAAASARRVLRFTAPAYR